MADLSYKSFSRSSRWLGLLLVNLALAAGSGCVMLEGGLFTKSAEPPPTPVNDVMTIWDPGIRIAEDPMNGGAPLPGLAGRVYLANDELKRMVDAQGSIIVAVRDTTPGAAPNQPFYAVRCEFQELDLKRLKKKDIIGDGYTLFVPWPTYQPNIRHIEVQVCYAPKVGKHHYGTPTPIALRNENRFRIDQKQQVYGPNGQVALPPQPQTPR